ncbi:MAG: hypothetical protein HY762_09035 [Planctomycetes bacterium]|nr:hypothetical protein [Planctomycetota bacterium]
MAKRITGIFLILTLFLFITTGFGCGGKAAGPETAKARGESPARETGAPPERERAHEPTATGDSADVLRRLESEKTVEIKEKGTMSESYYQAGFKFYQELKFAEASEALTKALELNPNHDKAQTLLTEIRLSRGEYTPGEMGDVSRKLFSEIVAKTQQAKLEVEHHLNKGIQAYNQEDYQKAEEEFKWVVESVKWFPYKADLEKYQKEAESYLKRTQENKAYKEVELARRREKSARQLSEIEEQKRREEFARTIEMLFRQAREEFDKERYDKANALCQTILEKDPSNLMADKLRVISLAALRHKSKRLSTQSLAEEWKRTFEIYDTKTLPVVDVINFPDKETWEKIEHRGPKKIFKEKTVSELDKQTELFLERKINLPFKEPTSLNDVIKFIRDTFPKLNIYADSAIADPNTTLTYNVVGIPLGEALKDMLSTNKWGYFIRDGVVIITTVEKVLEHKMETRWYDILDLTIPLIDYPGPAVSLGTLPVEEPGTESQIPRISGQQLVELIKATTAKNEGGWETPRDAVFQENAGVLVVTHIPEVHRQIETLLNQVRSAADIVVTIESRFITVEQHFLEDIGVNFSGLNSPQLPSYFSLAPPDGAGFTGLTSGIYGTYQKQNVTSLTPYRRELRARIEHNLSASDPYAKFLSEEEPSPTGGAIMAYTLLDQTAFRLLLSAVQKNETATIVNAPQLTVGNGQRAHIQITDQFTYIKDYDIVIVLPGVGMADPIPDVTAQGIVLDVRPVVSSDLKYISLELRPTMASLTDPLPNLRTLRTTILSAGTRTVDIELPDMFLQRARGNAIIPDGGTLLMSCYSTGRNVDMASEVPLLGRLPVIGFFFKQRAKAYAKHVLLILIRAKISILSEEEKKL